MEANCARVLAELGGGDGARVGIKGYARWVYLGALSCGGNVMDYPGEAGKEAATRTQMQVCYELECSHAGYCDAIRFLMTNRRCDMSTFLNDAHKAQQKENEEAHKKGPQDGDNGLRQH